MKKAQQSWLANLICGIVLVALALVIYFVDGVGEAFIFTGAAVLIVLFALVFVFPSFKKAKEINKAFLLIELIVDGFIAIFFIVSVFDSSNSRNHANWIAFVFWVRGINLVLCTGGTKNGLYRTLIGLGVVSLAVFAYATRWFSGMPSWINGSTLNYPLSTGWFLQDILIVFLITVGGFFIYQGIKQKK
ncbi:MAG: hypothetical protein FWE36_08230 [Erysipelotrichales bacterium]|nr:hypothetical protein [Erysipelotrichales bacterium]